MLSLKIQTCQKLIARKVLCFSHSKVSKLDSINSRTVSINSRKPSNVSKLDSSLDPRSFRESRIENRVSSIELRGTVNLPLSGTVSKKEFFLRCCWLVCNSGCQQCRITFVQGHIPGDQINILFMYV